MNTKKNKMYRGYGVYMLLILAVILIWYVMSENSTTNSYTSREFEQALDNNSVAAVSVVQNREVPTGSLVIKYTDGSEHVLFVSDVNEAQQLMRNKGYNDFICQKLPAENWIMTLLPYLLIFGAIFILFVIMNNNAAAQGGGNKMMNFGKSRARLSTEEDNKVKFDQVAGLAEEKEELEEIVDFLRAPKQYT